ncbi:TPA: fibronectin type III domain-containing protein [Streptococcus pyogenes]|uniref:fibronectin type III domain-containing protein n=1 Tax=unclassified Peribacillus TaxID=2675266 RepID=UPI002B3DE513|nr:fibronectin type III domain-containing protein [Streptococcus pyogenes]
MKKFVPIFLILIMSIFIFLPVYGVSAATVKPSSMFTTTDFVLDGTPLPYTAGLSDGNTTKVQYTLGAISDTTNDSVVMVFDETIKLNKLNVGFLSTVDLKLTAYDANKQSLGSVKFVTTGIKSAIESWKGKDIKFLYLENLSSSSASVTEFLIDSVSIAHPEISNVLSTVTDKSFSMTWNTPKDNPNFIQTNIYKNGTKIANVAKEIDVWKDDDVLPNTSYTYKLTAVYDDGFETSGVNITDITSAEPPDPSKIPPSNVTDLAVSNITDTSLELGWLNPDDDDLDKINIYKNGTLLESIPVNSMYKVIGLTPNTSYTFSVSAVDTDGNEGTKQTTTATTLDGKDNVAPDAPKGLTVEAGNKVLYLKWNKNLEDDLLGYNVFVNGVKQNTIPIKNTFFTIADLSNGTDYNVSISAVDTSSNESPRTTEKQGIPNEDGMPLLSTDYDLIDVAKGVENWFSSFWLIIAFAIAIPLSFYIASRIKLMFLE